jgi:arylformamidase
MPQAFDPAWLDGQYNNRARIPEHPQIFARWAADSARARQSHACRLDLPYGDAPGETLDLFLPPRPEAPVLVFIHGGWWRSLDKADHSFIAPAFVDAGAMVVVPNYTLAPAASIEQITLQMVRLLAWTWRHAEAHGGDPRRIVVAGHSAGGHLAAMMLCCLWPAVASDLPAGLVRSAMSISGVFDLEPIRHTPFLQGDLRLTTGAVGRLSPVNLPAPDGVLHACVGADESEEFLRQNRLIRDAWGESVVPVCEAVAGRHHLDVLDELAKPQGRLFGLAQQLLAR